MKTSRFNEGQIIKAIKEHEGGRKAEDTYPLPTPDKLTGVHEFTKYCFWLNASYVKNENVDENDIQL